MTRLWRLDRLEVVRKWKDLEKFVRWIGNIGRGNRYEGMRIVCLHSGRQHLQKLFGTDEWRTW